MATPPFIRVVAIRPALANKTHGQTGAVALAVRLGTRVRLRRRASCFAEFGPTSARLVRPQQV